MWCRFFSLSFLFFFFALLKCVASVPGEKKKDFTLIGEVRLLQSGVLHMQRCTRR